MCCVYSCVLNVLQRVQSAVEQAEARFRMQEAAERGLAHTHVRVYEQDDSGDDSWRVDAHSRPQPVRKRTAQHVPAEEGRHVHWREPMLEERQLDLRRSAEPPADPFSPINVYVRQHRIADPPLSHDARTAHTRVEDVEDIARAPVADERPIAISVSQPDEQDVTMRDRMHVHLLRAEIAAREQSHGDTGNAKREQEQAEHGSHTAQERGAPSPKRMLPLNDHAPAVASDDDASEPSDHAEDSSEDEDESNSTSSPLRRDVEDIAVDTRLTPRQLQSQLLSELAMLDAVDQSVRKLVLFFGLPSQFCTCFDFPFFSCADILYIMSIALTGLSPAWAACRCGQRTCDCTGTAGDCGTFSGMTPMVSYCEY